jgi:hypothetical protein
VEVHLAAEGLNQIFLGHSRRLSLSPFALYLPFA